MTQGITPDNLITLELTIYQLGDDHIIEHNEMSMDFNEKFYDNRNTLFFFLVHFDCFLCALYQ